MTEGLIRMDSTEHIDVPAHDDLIERVIFVDEIKLTTPGEYKRGELLMSNSDNEFTKATESGVSAASELCILARNVTLDEGHYTMTTGYFAGVYNPDRIILPYETDTDNHGDKINAIKTFLRKQFIYV